MTSLADIGCHPRYPRAVFVRRVTTRSKGAASGVSYRLVHSQRLGPHKIRQLVLAYFPAGLEQRVPKPHWKRLAAAIKDLLAGQAALPADPDQDPSQQALAERIAAEAEAATPLVRRRLRDADCDFGFHIADDPQPATAGETPVAILPSSLRHTDVREVGAARLLQLQARALGLRACLTASGLRPRHVRLGLAQILARALHPASERETWRWLRHDSALGELLGLQPSDLSKDSLYTAADALWQRHERLESALFARECALFGLQPRIVFYDLTNTYHTGRPAHKYAAHGRSKQKRHEAPLVTLGLLLDGEGFPRRSEVLAGNVGEARTLQGAIERLDRGQGERPTVVFDGGIVSAANLRWLRQRGLHWVTVERQRQAAPERDPDTLWESAGGRELKVWRLQAEAGESAAAGRTETDGGAATPAGEQEAGAGAEARLCVWSPARDKDEQAMLERKRARYEAALRSLHEGLTTPRRLKNYAKVVRKVGRLERGLQAGRLPVHGDGGARGEGQGAGRALGAEPALPGAQAAARDEPAAHEPGGVGGQPHRAGVLPPGGHRGDVPLVQGGAGPAAAVPPPGTAGGGAPVPDGAGVPRGACAALPPEAEGDRLQLAVDTRAHADLGAADDGDAHGGGEGVEPAAGRGPEQRAGAHCGGRGPELPQASPVAAAGSRQDLTERRRRGEQEVTKRSDRKPTWGKFRLMESMTYKCGSPRTSKLGR